MPKYTKVIPYTADDESEKQIVLNLVTSGYIPYTIESANWIPVDSEWKLQLITSYRMKKADFALICEYVRGIMRCYSHMGQECRAAEIKAMSEYSNTATGWAYEDLMVMVEERNDDEDYPKMQLSEVQAKELIYQNSGDIDDAMANGGNDGARYALEEILDDVSICDNCSRAMNILEPEEDGSYRLGDNAGTICVQCKEKNKYHSCDKCEYYWKATELKQLYPDGEVKWFCPNDYKDVINEYNQAF